MSSTNSDYSHLYALVNDYLAKSVEKRKDLQELDLFVLDNSLRESTVGQVRGHSLTTNGPSWRRSKSAAMITS